MSYVNMIFFTNSAEMMHKKLLLKNLFQSAHAQSDCVGAGWWFETVRLSYYLVPNWAVLTHCGKLKQNDQPNIFSVFPRKQKIILFQEIRSLSYALLPSNGQRAMQHWLQKLPPLYGMNLISCYISCRSMNAFIIFYFFLHPYEAYVHICI